MGRYLTDKYQTSAEKFEGNRLENAVGRFDSKDVQDVPSAQVLQGPAHGSGYLAACFAGIIALFLSMISPHGSDDIYDFMVSSDGAYYINLNGKLHPVTNLASARLILGTAHTTIRVVSDKRLASMPRGLLMGIPTAPTDLRQAPTDHIDITICDSHTEENRTTITSTKNMITTSIVGPVYGTELINGINATAVLVTINRELWVLWGTVRSRIAYRDLATRSALGLTNLDVDNPLEISPMVFNAIPSVPPITVPALANNNQPSRFNTRYRIGDVLQVKRADGVVHSFVVTQGGATPTPPFVTQLFLNTRHPRYDVSDLDIGTFPLTQDFPVDQYPSDFPTFLHPHVVCYMYSRSGSVTPETKILTGNSLPTAAAVNETHTKITGVSAQVATDQIGHLIRITDLDPNSFDQEAWFWLDATGLRFSISPDDKDDYTSVLKNLGWSSATAVNVPWELIRTFPPGGDLSVAEAFTEHVYIPPDDTQHAVKHN